MTNAALIVFSVVHMVARIITGECGGVAQEAGPAMAIIAMNRREIGWGWSGWNAIADEPENWALDIAWEAWRKGEDTSGNLYALSGADMESLGFGEDDWENVGNDKWPIWVGRAWQ